MKKLLSNIKGFFLGWYQLRISQQDIIYSFYGFNHFNFAKKYADKRYKRNGRKHWVIPAGKGSEQMVVFNTIEKDLLQAQGHMNRRVKAHHLSKSAYHTAGAGQTKKK